MLRAAAALACLLAVAHGVPDAAQIESHTDQLMGQILAAVSTKSDDSNLMARLCDMVNEVETAVMAMTSTEDQDSEFALARLRAELDDTNANLSSVRIEYNQTAKELATLINQHRPLPVQLKDAKAREADFLRQRELLASECTQDLQGQRTRVDAINVDMSVLEETIEHLSKLSQIGAPAPPPAAADPLSLLELGSSAAAPKCDRAALAAQTLGPVVQCENDLVVPVRASEGTISTLPPGEGMAYQKSRQCTFRISPTDIDVLDRVELAVLALDTQESDPVLVYDGPAADPEHLLARLTGNTAPPQIRSVNFNQMTVVFSPAALARMSPGFMANYRAVKVPRDRSSSLNECAAFDGVPIVLTGNGGFISEDSRPEFADAMQAGAGTAYRSALGCRWLIQALPGQTIRLHFTFLNTLKAEFVDVYDGPSDEGQAVLLHQSGAVVPGDVSSSSSAMFVTYSADFAVAGKGFHASWCIEGTDCPTLPKPALPPAAPPAATPEEPHNASAPSVPAPTAEAARTPAVLPPAYPMAPPATPRVALMEKKSLCANACSGHGVCQPDTATCLCSAGFEGTDCSRGARPDLAALEQLLLEEDSGLLPGQNTDGAKPVLGLAQAGLGARQAQDECGDDDASPLSTVGLATIDADPVKTLLQQLKFELQRSLVYEHDTTNLTNRQCNRDLQELDAELEEMQQSILKLSKGMSELDIAIEALREKNASLFTRLQSYREYAAEVTQQIKARRGQTSTRSDALGTQVAALQSMRDIISQLGSHTCTKATVVSSFAQQEGVVCSGELLDTQKVTQDPEECKPLCSLGCAGFSFTVSEGCRFYSGIESQVPCPSGSPSTCSCFTK